MSVDPASPSASEPTPSGEPTPENVEIAKMKKRFKKGAGGAETEEEEDKPDQAIQLLSTLLQDLIAKKEQPAVAETETKTGKYHRLAKTGSGSPGASPEAAPSPVPPTDAAAITPSSSAPDRPAGTTTVPPGAPAPPPKFRSAPLLDDPTPRRKARRQWMLYALGSLALATGAFYAGRQFAPAHPDVAPQSTDLPVAATSKSTWTDPALAQLDQALAADQAGDLDKATQLATAFKKPTETLPGLDLYLPTLLIRLMHNHDAEADLSRLLDVNTPPLRAAAINERLAFNYSRNRDFQKASECLAVAARLDPFSAPVFYHWAESLRRHGRLDEAVDRFRQTLQRVPSGQPEMESLRDCTNFKLRLSLIELGKEGEIQPALDEHLKGPTPSGYWLLTAAAVALQHNDIPGAVGSLGRAREALTAEQFEALLNDYFFRTYSNRKELAEYLPSDVSARRAKLLPSMVYSIEP